MVKKILGYVLAVIGIIAIASSFIPQVQTLIMPILPEALNETYLLIAGAVVFIIGIFLIIRNSKHKQKSMEVPIYHGKNVVGYRRN